MDTIDVIKKIEQFIDNELDSLAIDIIFKEKSYEEERALLKRLLTLTRDIWSEVINERLQKTG